MELSEQILSYLGNERENHPIYYFETVPSTNTVARRLAEEGAIQGTTVIAASQSDGRGRRGRTFFSPTGGLYMSIILRPAFDPKNTLFVTTAAAVAVCRAVERFVPEKCRIKWVNDVYIGDRKVCGILTEGAFDAKTGTMDHVILGIGLNLTRPEAGYPAEIADRADAVFGSRVPTEAETAALTAELLREFDALYRSVGQKDFLAEYRERSYLTGKTVTFERDGETHSARVIGIDDAARLIVEEDGRTVALRAGEVSVKRV